MTSVGIHCSTHILLVSVGAFLLFCLVIAARRIDFVHIGIIGVAVVIVVRIVYGHRVGVGVDVCFVNMHGVLMSIIR